MRKKKKKRNLSYKFVIKKFNRPKHNNRNTTVTTINDNNEV